MFSIGEYVVYGVEGVCRVEEAGKLKVAGLDKNRAYYRLRPYYHDGTIYTPVDGKAVMRPVLTREELERLLPRLPELEPLGRCAAGQPRSRRILPRYFIRARLRCASAPVQDAPRQAEQPDGQPTAASTRPNCAAGAWPRRCSTGSSALRLDFHLRRCGTICAKSWADKAQRSARSASIYAGPVPQQPPSRLAPSCLERVHVPREVLGIHMIDSLAGLRDRGQPCVGLGRDGSVRRGFFHHAHDRAHLVRPGRAVEAHGVRAEAGQDLRRFLGGAVKVAFAVGIDGERA